MLTRAFFQKASSYGRLGRGLNAARSTSSKSSLLDLPSLRMGLSLSFSSSGFTTSLTSESDVKWRWRSAASIHRSASSTPTSTFALSRGRRGHAGRIAKP
jgi:hypothetical protein